MSNTQTRATLWRRMGLASATFALVALAWGFLAALPAPFTEGERIAEAGWGSEVLAEVHEGLVLMSPIGAANACGLGASSCFKCHNGQRAAAPTMDAAKAPWHTQHKSVNNSCVGCHSGNPRLMKQDMAHAKLVANPRTTTEASCSSCHSGANVAELVKPYLAINGGEQ